MDITTPLKKIGSKACLAASAQVEAAVLSTGTFSLQFRSLGLVPTDAAALAEVLISLSARKEGRLRSLSFSYNPALGDAGLLNLLIGFPDSLREVGLVGCGVKDEGGEALLHWAEQASDLQMLCIEQNNFSVGLKARFRQFQTTQPGLLLVI